MTIPERLQIFETRVVLTDKDAERLKAHLGNWEKLAGLLTVGVNELDVQRLIVLELMGKGREKLLERLLMRFGRLYRNRITAAVKSCLKAPSNAG